MAVSPVFGGNHGIDGANNAQKSLNDLVLPNGNVVGTAVGLKDGQAVLKVFTARNGVAGIPKKHGGFDVEVQVTGLINALPPKAQPSKSGSSEFTSKVNQLATGTFSRPVPIGVSTGNERLIKYRGRWYCTVGTIAARVTDGANVYALSNNHVYALENEAVIGDNILQPGRVDMPAGGCGSSSEIANAKIGTLERYEPIVFGGNNTIDAALAAIDNNGSGEPLLGNATPSEGYGLPSSATVDAAINMPVQKYGRTTELTTGIITSINATMKIGYGGGNATFVEQIIIEDPNAFILGGDSGSMLVTNDGSTNPNPVGLLFAGNSSGTFAIANDIDVVLSTFGVTIDGAGDAGDSGGPTATPVPPTTTPIPPTATPVPPGGSDDIWVSSIDLVHQTRGRGELLSTVFVVDTSGGVSGATVGATLSRDGASWDLSGSTNDSGTVTFKLKFPLSTYTYTLCVDSVSYTQPYDESQNVETCDSIAIP